MCHGSLPQKANCGRDVLRELQHTTAYVNCAEWTRARPLLQSVLSQLKARRQGHDPARAVRLGVAPPQKPAKYIVVDHVERIADSDLLAVLLKAREITGASVGLILISSVSWGSSIFECDTLRVVRPMQLPFPAYEDDVLTKIIALGCPSKEDVESYVRFIGSYMYDFARVSRRLEDLQKVIQNLYPVYLQPVRDGKIESDNATALFAAFAPHFREAVANFTYGAAAATIVPKHHKPRADAKPTSGLDFELPYNSKLLLLAAYIASRNRPNLDKRLFDTGPGKRRRNNAMASDRQAEGAKEAQLRGPITFPQERLLSYFWNLLKSEGADDEAAAWDEGAAHQQQSAEVFMLLRSLVSLRLLSQARLIPHVSVWLLDYSLLGALL
ncbi:TPA: hypothetical protein ACH3X1_012075 [Trebouxia sp. C0004]